MGPEKESDQSNLGLKILNLDANSFIFLDSKLDLNIGSQKFNPDP